MRVSNTHRLVLSVHELNNYNGLTNGGPGRELGHQIKQATPTPAGKSRPPLYTAWDKAGDVVTHVTFGVRDCVAFHKFAASVLDTSKGKLSQVDSVAFTYAFGAKELPDSFRWRTPQGMGKEYDDFVASRLGTRAADVGGVNGTDCFKNAVRQFLGIRKAREKAVPRSGNGYLNRLLKLGLGDMTTACKAIVSLMKCIDAGWHVKIRCRLISGVKVWVILLPSCFSGAGSILGLSPNALGE